MKKLTKDQRKLLAEFLGNFAVAWLAAGIIAPVMKGGIDTNDFTKIFFSITYSVILIFLMLNLVKPTKSINKERKK